MAIVSQSTKETSVGNVVLPVFDGHPDSCVALWFTQVNAIFMARNVPIHQRFGFIMTGLSNTALQWYSTIFANASETNSLPFNGDWKSFQKEFTAAFSRPNRLFHLRRKLKTLKQKDEMLTYVYQFRKLVSHIENMSENDKIVYFIEGLKDKVRKRLSIEPPTTLEAAVTLAVNYYTSVTETSLFPQQVDHMSMVPMEINAVGEIRKCLYCKKAGHLIKDCYRLKSKNEKKEINEVSVGFNKKNFEPYLKPECLLDEFLLNQSQGSSLLSF